MKSVAVFWMNIFLSIPWTLL